MGGIVTAFQETEDGVSVRVNGARLEALLQLMKRPLESYTRAAMKEGKVSEYIPALRVTVTFAKHRIAYL